MRLKEDKAARIEEKLAGGTLVLAAPGVGNVGQLCAELLVENLNLEFEGALHSPYLSPVAAADESGKGLLSAADLYCGKPGGVSAVLLRSYCPARHWGGFVGDVISFAEECGVSSLTILASRFASDRLPTFGHFRTSDFRPPGGREIGWTDDDRLTVEDLDASTGGSWAACLALACSEQYFPCCLATAYCSEGDNAPDAVRMFHFLNAGLGLLPSTEDFAKTVRIPSAWKLAFGGPPPVEIY